MRCFSLRRAARLLIVSSLCATTIAFAAVGVSAQETAQPQAQTQAPAPAPTQTRTDDDGQPTTQTAPQGEETTPAAAASPAAAPLYSEFKGVKIGTSRDEARKMLGNPREKDKQQDFFLLSDRERARVYYDDKGAATAVIVTYVGKSGDIPTPKAILGAEPEQKPDGSMYKIAYYPEAGYWVAYSRTAGDDPLTIITMQRIESK